MVKRRYVNDRLQAIYETTDEFKREVQMERQSESEGQPQSESQRQFETQAEAEAREDRIVERYDALILQATNKPEERWGLADRLIARRDRELRFERGRYTECVHTTEDHEIGQRLMDADAPRFVTEFDGQVPETKSVRIGRYLTALRRLDLAVMGLSPEDRVELEPELEQQTRAVMLTEVVGLMIHDAERVFGKATNRG